MRPSIPNPFFAAVGKDVPYRDAVQCGDFVFVSGQTSIDHETLEAQYPGDMAAQGVEAIERVEGLLNAFGLSRRHIVRLHTYFNGPRSDAERAIQAQAAALGTASACTAVGVDGLVRDGLLAEVDAIAVADTGTRQVATRRSHRGLVAAGVTAGPLAFLSGHAARHGSARGAGRGDIASELELILTEIDATLAEFDADRSRILKITALVTASAVAEAVEATLTSLVPEVALTCLVVPYLIDDGSSVVLDAVAAREGKITAVRADGVVAAVSCDATPLVFIAGQQREKPGGDMPTQMAEVMESLQRSIGSAGGGIDDIVKQQLFYADWTSWSDSVDVRRRYVREPLAAIAVGAGGSATDAKVVSDAIAYRPPNQPNR